jgi:hypothetical protein
MHDYLTRHLVATRPMTYAQRELVEGDPFTATPVDADYLVRCGRAREAAQTVVPPAAASAPPAPQPEPQEPQGQTPGSQLDLVAEQAAAPTEDAAAEPASDPAPDLVLGTPALQKPVTARGRSRSA